MCGGEGGGLCVVISMSCHIAEASISIGGPDFDLVW